MTLLTITRTEHPQRNIPLGDEICVKINKRLGNKLSPKYKKETVSQNLKTTVKTNSGTIVHKNNIKQSYKFKILLSYFGKHYETHTYRFYVDSGDERTTN